MHISVHSRIGKREYQEDRHAVIPTFAGFKHLTLCIVCDGHGGYQASSFLIKEFPLQLVKIVQEQAALRTNKNSKARKRFTEMLGLAMEACIVIWEKLCFGSWYGKIKNDADKRNFYAQRDERHWEKNGLEAGSTCVCMLIDLNKRRAHFLSIGDSRAAWIKGEAGSGTAAHGATVDHNVRRKMEPTKDGFAVKVEDGRLQGDLAMSHAFGDLTEALYGAVDRGYDLYVCNFKEKNMRAVVASDGLFDFTQNQGVLFEVFENAEHIARDVLERRQVEMNSMHDDMRRAWQQSGTEKKDIPPCPTVDDFTDNVTIIYVKIEALKSGETADQEEEEEGDDEDRKLEEKQQQILARKIKESEKLAAEIQEMKISASSSTSASSTSRGTSTARGKSVERKPIATAPTGSSAVRKKSVSRPSAGDMTVVHDKASGATVHFVRKTSRKK